jgi:glycosyltransferase involved in cell wall biosynthesis
MMLAKPILTAQGTNADRIALDAGNGLVVHYGSTAELEAACLELAYNPARRLALGSAGRAAYEKTYSWDRMSQRLHDLYAKIIPLETGR